MNIGISESKFSLSKTCSALPPFYYHPHLSISMHFQIYVIFQEPIRLLYPMIQNDHAESYV